MIRSGTNDLVTGRVEPEPVSAPKSASAISGMVFVLDSHKERHFASNLCEKNFLENASHK